MQSSLLVVVVTLLLFQYGECWKNRLDGSLYFKCPYGQAISYIRSIHYNRQEDRLWDFRCKKLRGTQRNCRWSGYVNDWRGTFAYQCPGRGYIRGIQSYHSNARGDRRHRFLCCEQSGYKYIHSCQFTSFNQYYKQVREHVRNGYVWRGLVSQFNSLYRDRIFSFQMCKIN